MPTAIATCEVRWFLEGPVSAHPALRQWFESGPSVGTTSTLPPPEWKGRLGGRPDRYLLFPGAMDMGVKWREGELQIKGRVEELGAQRFGGEHIGFVERWCKWSYAHIPSLLHSMQMQMTAESKGSVDVHKTRALRTLLIDDAAGTIREVDESVQVTRGINAELTDVRVGDAGWCSLALEAFPDDAALREPFLRGVSQFLSSLDSMLLTSETSLSYPGWLSGLVP